MEHTIQINETTRSRRLKLEISQSGEVVVSVPRGTPRWVVNRFIQSNQDWIQRHQRKHKHKTSLLSSSYIYLFGHKYDFVVTSDQMKPGFVIDGERLLYTPVAGKHETKPSERLLQSFLKTTCSAYIVPRTKQIAEQMDITYGKISFKEQKTRWGSCSSTGTLSFNWRLVHFKPTYIDYVITHELAHRKHPNHSREFWKFVKQYYPEVAAAKKAFQRYYW